MIVREDPPADGLANMALDSALLGAAQNGSALGRVYRWKGPWVSLGRFQNAEKDLLDPDGISWVIRPTGGKAVLHGHDVTVALAFPLGCLDADPRSIRSVYRAIVRPLVEALTVSGRPAALAEETRYAERGQRTADCFAFTSPNDIVDPATGHKVCGCALRVTDRAVLLQASIPTGPPLVDPTSVIRNATRMPDSSWDSTGLADALAKRIG